MTKTLQINLRITPEQKQLIKDKASKMGLIKCNQAVICQNNFCPHFHPHSSHPVKPYRHPQCEDKGTYCYTEKRAVNCVPAKINTRISLQVELKGG